MVASPSAPSPAHKRGIRNRPDVGGRLVVLPAGDGGLGEGHRCRRSPGETKRDRGRRRSTPPHPISTRADTSIEMLSSPPKTAAIWLHPMQMRGLKLHNVDLQCVLHQVAPRAGAWIEMTRRPRPSPLTRVAPRAGAQIERISSSSHSRPTPAPCAGVRNKNCQRERGKRFSLARTPCECVGSHSPKSPPAAPFAANQRRRAVHPHPSPRRLPPAGSAN